jgi:S-DNA-T family DNA segregation ATPase FtsK/SpoIIIE
VKWLALEVDRRATRYSKAGAGSLAEYRGRPEYGAEPRILLLVDAFQAFQKAYETADRTQTLDLFQQIVSGGTQFGVHVVLTADRPASVPLALASSIPTRMALRLADPSDYSYLGMPSDVITHTSPPGRGMLLGTELQVAVLGMPGSAGRPIRVDSRHQAEAAAEFAITLRQGGIPEAKPILGMPERVLLAQLAATVGDRPVLGMAAETLAEATFEPRGGFLISGPSGSGRTATLRSLANALLRWNKEIQLILFSPTERSDLAALDVWTERALGADKVRQHAELLARHLQSGTHPPVAVFLEGVTDFTVPNMQMEVVNAVTGLVSACLSADVLVVGEAETSTYRGKLGPVELLKRSRYGLALSPDSADGDAVFSTRFPIRVSRAAYPPGHGLLVRGGQTTQVAVGWVDETP